VAGRSGWIWIWIWNPHDAVGTKDRPSDIKAEESLIFRFNSIQFNSTQYCTIQYNSVLYYISIKESIEGARQAVGTVEGRKQADYK
jgi:hypothetical protein